MTLYFQLQFIRVSCTVDTRNKIRNSIKNREINSAIKRKNYNPERQKQYEKMKYKRKPSLKKEYQRKKN